MELIHQIEEFEMFAGYDERETERERENIISKRGENNRNKRQKYMQGQNRKFALFNKFFIQKIQTWQNYKKIYLRLVKI